MKEIRVAIIGAGMISHRHMVIYKNIEAMSDRLGFKAKVVAVSEIIPSRLEAWREQYGFDEKDCYIDFREMLKRDDIDAVDVCVHNNLHTPVSIQVLKSGHDVYLEKPMAASWHDAQMVIDCANKLGRKLHVQISSLMTAQTRAARELVAKGRLGDIYYVNLESVTRHRRPGYDIPAFTADFCSKRVAGHGPSIDMGVYLISQLLYIMGMPKLVSVNGFARHALPVDKRLITTRDGYDVEDIADGFAKFENGVGFHFMMTSAAHTEEYSKTLMLGTRGGIELANADCGGGRLALKPGQVSPWDPPSVRFFGDVDGHEVTLNMETEWEDLIEQMADINRYYYNDNQIMWLAWKLGLLKDEERYNTPEIASNMLLFTDGIFLSEEMGRSVSADEIRELSPSLYIKEQEIDGQIVRYDCDF